MSCIDIVVGDVTVRVMKDGKELLTTQDYDDAKRFVEFIKSKVDKTTSPEELKGHKDGEI